MKTCGKIGSLRVGRPLNHVPGFQQHGGKDGLRSFTASQKVCHAMDAQSVSAL